MEQQGMSSRVNCDAAAERRIGDCVAAADTNSILIEVVHETTPPPGEEEGGERGLNQSPPMSVLLSSNRAVSQSQSSSVDEDCLTVTEVTELSTIDEITVEDEEEYDDEHSCRTTATMVSSNAGSPPSLTDQSITTTTSGTEGTHKTRRGCPKKPSIVAEYLRIASRHCQVNFSIEQMHLNTQLLQLYLIKSPVSWPFRCFVVCYVD